MGSPSAGSGPGLGRLLRPGRPGVPLVRGPGEKAHAVCHDAGADRRRAASRTQTPGQSPVRPMALHRGGPAPGRQGCPSHPAAGGEGAAPPHTAWVHRQGRGRRQDSPPHGWNGWHWGVASRLLGLLIMTLPHHAGALFLGCPSSGPAGAGISRPPPGRILRCWARAWTRKVAWRTPWSAGRPWSRRLKPS